MEKERTETFKDSLYCHSDRKLPVTIVMQLYSAVFCFLFIFPTVFSSNKCVSENGVICECTVEESGIKLRNCVRPGGWSTWSKWSKCRDGLRKRRRTCSSPHPIGITCVGDRVEKQKCASVPSLPEYLFGSWTSWNGWSRCDCQKNLRFRTRQCKGRSCEGCEKIYEECGPEECPINKKWSDWTDWTDYANWSEWHVHPGIAYRYRLLPNTSITVEHHLLSRTTSSCLPLYFAIPTFCLCILTGFLLQTLISCVLTRCQRRFSRSTYYYDSNPRDYPSHLIRSPKDETVW